MWRQFDRLLEGRVFPALLLLGVVLRVAAIVSFPVYPLVDNTADTAIYDEGARSLAAGEGYRWGGRLTAFFPIGWPLLLSMAYRVAGESARSGQALNFLFSLVLLLACWFLVHRLAGRRAGRLAALVLAFAPHHVVYPAFLMSETSFTAFFLLSLGLVAVAVPPGREHGEKLPLLIGAGVLMGAATLIRGPALVFPLAVAAWTFVSERGRAVPRMLRSMLCAFVFGLGLLLAVAPWATRNHRVFDRWVLVANDGGMNFLMGNHHGATGARHEPVEGLPDLGNEVADDREGYRRGAAFIKENPGEFLTLLPKKFVRLVAPASLLTYRAELRAKWPEPLALTLLAIDQLLHAVLWIMALVAVLKLRSHPAVRFGAVMIGLWVLIHLAFLGGARYFYPVMPLLLLVAASARFSEREA
ncbi:MAG TPA: glycosyltransferase family 39 protein [Candidatus Eisenbacteria bacterium]